VVAAVFLSTCKDVGDSIQGKILATNWLLEEAPSASRAKFLPYIEVALGRKLTPAELERGAIDHV